MKNNCSHKPCFKCNRIKLSASKCVKLKTMEKACEDLEADKEADGS